MSKVTARRREGYTHDVEIDEGHSLVIDEPVDSGGGDKGPSPVRTLSAALAACTAITIEMYADRKGWDLGNIEVEVETGYSGPTPTSFVVTIRLPGGLPEEHIEKLRVIAGKCPVHRVIAGETSVSIEDKVERV